MVAPFRRLSQSDKGVPQEDRLAALEDGQQAEIAVSRETVTERSVRGCGDVR